MEVFDLHPRCARPERGSPTKRFRGAAGAGGVERQDRRGRGRHRGHLLLHGRGREPGRQPVGDRGSGVPGVPQAPGGQDRLVGMSVRFLAIAVTGMAIGLAAEARAASPVSPTGNGRHETSFQAAAKSGAGILRWEFRVASESDAKVVRKMTAEGEPPKTLTWNAKDDAGKPVADGKYLYILQVWDVAGNTSFSEEKTILADSVAPTFTISAEALPDAVAVASLSGADAGESGFAKWRVQAQNASGQSVRVFAGDGTPPKELVWDLRDANGNTVPEGKYALVGMGEDGAGNKSDAARAEVDLTGKSAPPIPLSF